MKNNNGPPKVTCCQCNQTVLKSTTRHIGDGKRACKSHDGTVDKANEVQAKTEANLEQKRQKEKNRFKKSIKNQRDNDSSDFMIKAQLWANFTCWCCNKKGIQLQHIFERRLIAMEKLQLRGVNFNPLDPEFSMQMIKEMNIPIGTLALRRFDLPEDRKERAKWMNMLHKGKDSSNKRMSVNVIGFMQLCPHCAKKFGLEFMPDLPKPTFKQLINMATVYENTVGKGVKKIAAKEIFMEETPESAN